RLPSKGAQRAAAVLTDRFQHGLMMRRTLPAAHHRLDAVLQRQFLLLEGNSLVLLLIGEIAGRGELLDAFVEPVMLRNQFAEGVVVPEQRVFYFDRLVRELSVGHAPPPKE